MYRGKPEGTKGENDQGRGNRRACYFSRATTKSGAHNKARLNSLSGKLQMAFRARVAYCRARALAASSDP